jgi:hypothetical protein
MTYSEEEHLLIDMLIGTRNSLERAKSNVKAAQDVQQSFEKQLADVEQALVDYCTANGVIQFSCGNHRIFLGKSESVDIPNVEAVPEEYTRIKREPDKMKIKNTRPEGANWYTIKESNHITLRSKTL